MAMPEWRRVKQTLTFSERLKAEAVRLQREADNRPPGPERDDLIRKVGQLEKALRIVNWVSSPGLKPPT
jgi:hypothetical protein